MSQCISEFQGRLRDRQVVDHLPKTQKTLVSEPWNKQMGSVLWEKEKDYSTLEDNMLLRHAIICTNFENIMGYKPRMSDNYQMKLII